VVDGIHNNEAYISISLYKMRANQIFKPTNRFSGSGSTIDALCVGVFARQLSNEISSFNPDIWHGDLSSPYIGQGHRSRFAVRGGKTFTARKVLVLQRPTVAVASS